MSAPKIVVIIDPSKVSREKAALALASLHYEPRPAADVSEAEPLIDGAHAVIAVHPAGEPLYPRLRTGGTPLIVSLSSKQPRPQALAAHLGGDAFVTRPYRKEAIALALYAAENARLLRERATRSEMALAQLAGVAKSREHGTPGLLHVDLFKTLLPMEIRRARRHGYPIALMVAAIDPLPGHEEAVEGLALACEPILRKAVRDVDLAVRYGEGRFLVFLPHTDAAGAETVGRRIVEEIRGSRVRVGGATLTPTASVGVATARKEKPLSFAQMVRDAHAALRAAQLKGGDRAIAR